MSKPQVWRMFRQLWWDQQYGAKTTSPTRHFAFTSLFTICKIFTQFVSCIKPFTPCAQFLLSKLSCENVIVNSLNQSEASFQSRDLLPFSQSEEKLLLHDVIAAEEESKESLSASERKKENMTSPLFCQTRKGTSVTFTMRLSSSCLSSRGDSWSLWSSAASWSGSASCSWSTSCTTWSESSPRSTSCSKSTQSKFA